MTFHSSASVHVQRNLICTCVSLIVCTLEGTIETSASNYFNPKSLHFELRAYRSKFAKFFLSYALGRDKRFNVQFRSLFEMSSISVTKRNSPS